MGKKSVANIDNEDRGTKLISEAGFGHKAKGKGDATGLGSGEAGAEHLRGHYGEGGFGAKPFTFRGAGDDHMASGYGHSIMQRKGVYRMSGHKGGHMLGRLERSKTK